MSVFTQNTTFVGNVRRDSFGRIVVDQCKSDGEHLSRDLTPEERADRQTCRKLVEEAFTTFEGKRGIMYVYVSFAEIPEFDLPGEETESTK